MIRIGLVIILLGIAGLSAMLDSGVAVAVGIAAWTVAGLGMGMSYSPTTLLMLADAPPGREGWASASLNLADVLGAALGIGIGGAAISAAVRFGWSLAAGIGVAFAITAAAGVACFAITRRLPLGTGPRSGEVMESASVPGASGGSTPVGNTSSDISDLRVGHADQVGGR